MNVVARQQERAVRASVLEQALAMRRERRDIELEARVAGLGLSFEDELRAVVVRPVRMPSSNLRRTHLDNLYDALSRALAGAGVANVISERSDCLTLLAQCSVNTLQRALVSSADILPDIHVGIGRPVGTVGEVVDSANDAHLAVRTLRRSGTSFRVMSYEDFDFATRLFADVGLERMVGWAEDFLRPLHGRQNLIEGLQCFFEFDQNINLASEALSIHHNSLRYRLAKVEELLKINLRQPSAVSSVFLALTALELEQPSAERRWNARRVQRPSPQDLDAPSTATHFGRRTRENLGVDYSQRGS